MINFIKEQEKKLKKIILECGYSIENVNIVPSSRPDLGQYQFNGVMELAKISKTNPRIIANLIVEKMCDDDDYKDVNVAGPGFINITFSDKLLSNYIESTRKYHNYDKNNNKKKKDSYRLWWT